MKMVGRTQLCDIENCEKQAAAFGLNATSEVKSCDLHISALSTKAMDLYGIEGYGFILEPSDEELLGERKTAIGKTLRKLEVQEARVEAEYTAALQSLESEKGKLVSAIEAQCLEIRKAVAKRYAEVKQQFSSLKTNLAQYSQRRENKLAPIAQLLCEERDISISYIRLVFGAVIKRVNRAIKNSWFVSTEPIKSLFQAAVSVASLPATIEAAEEYYQKGLKFRNSRQWKEAEKCYVQARGIYEICAPQSTDAALNLIELGSLFNDSKKWSKAEECCWQAQTILENTDPQSMEEARNHTNFGFLYHHTARLYEAEQHYQQARHICETSGANSGTLAIALNGLGLLRSREKRHSEAVELHQQALNIYEALDSDSMTLAVMYYNIGANWEDLGQFKKAQEKYLLAKQICETADPLSMEFAYCLYNLGRVYEAQNQIEESIASFQYAAELFELNCSSEWKSNAESGILFAQAKLSKNSG